MIAYQILNGHVRLLLGIVLTSCNELWNLRPKSQIKSIVGHIQRQIFHAETYDTKAERLLIEAKHGLSRSPLVELNPQLFLYFVGDECFGIFEHVVD